MKENAQAKIKELITKGKEQGYLTYAEVNDHLPDGIIDSDQIEDIIGMITDMGIKVQEEVPEDDDARIFNDDASSEEDEDVADEAVQAITSSDQEFGRTTDPVRMYTVSYTHLRAHETLRYLVCRLLLEKKRDELVSLLQKAGSSDEEANNEALSQIANIDKMLKKRKFL